MAEQAFAYILAFVRLLPRFLAAQARHDWIVQPDSLLLNRWRENAGGEARAVLDKR